MIAVGFNGFGNKAVVSFFYYPVGGRRGMRVFAGAGYEVANTKSGWIGFMVVNGPFRSGANNLSMHNFILAKAPP